MKIHKIDISDFNEVNYELIALNTILDDYHLCFQINQKLDISLQRNTQDILYQGKVDIEGFSIFSFEDESQDVYWSLVQNQKWSSFSTDLNTLFAESQQKLYLLPEYKNVDFFLKIENAEYTDDEILEMISKLKNIKNVTAIFRVDVAALKSKNNLIF